MRRLWTVLILLSLMVSQADQGMASLVELDDELAVEYLPDSIELRPEETGNVELEFVNHGDEPLPVGLEFMVSKSPGGSRGRFSSSYFTLAPGGSKVVTCEITSHAEYGQDADISDARIMVMWGKGLVPIDGGAFDYSNASHDTITIDVVDDFSTQNMMIGLALVVLASVIILAIVISRRR